MCQRRFHAIRRKSSGAYFLPGSIDPPGPVVDGYPGRNLRDHTVAIEPRSESGRQRRHVVEPMVIRRILQTDLEMPRQRITQRRVGMVKREHLVPLTQTEAPRRGAGG